MRMLKFVAFALAVLSLSACSGKNSKGTTTTTENPQTVGNSEKLVGTWEVTKIGHGPPPGAMLEFAKDGKFSMTFTVDKQRVKAEGTYRVEGDKIAITLKLGDKEEKEPVKRIKTLTDTKLVFEEDSGVTELKKK